MSSSSIVNDLSDALNAVSITDVKKLDDASIKSTPNVFTKSESSSSKANVSAKSVKKHYPAYLSLEFSEETTVALRQLIYDNCNDIDDYSCYSTKRGEDDKGHLTVLFPRGIPKDAYKTLCDAIEDREGDSLELKVEGCVVDSSAIAIIAQVPALLEVDELVAIMPNQDHYHVTMMLADGVKPVYCKDLVAERTERSTCKTYFFSTDSPVYGKLTFVNYGKR